MIKALAPRIPRGCSWVWLSIVLVGGFPLAIDAQESVKTEAAAAESVAAGPPQAETLEIFKDPRAEEALPNTFPSLPGTTPIPTLIRTIRAMASRSIATDRSQIQRFVEGYAADLTGHTNIRAVINPPPHLGPGSSAYKAIEHATDGLIEPILTAKQAGNTEFLNVYTQVLVSTLSKLLNNHLLARIEAMIVLAQTGSPETVDLFISQLKNPKQTVWVKLWAAKGLANIVQNGTRTDDLGPRAIPVAEALADFLEREKEIPWPVQLRVLEALGAMRLAAVPASRDKAKMATAAVEYLANPDAKTEVRAEAAWAVGMMRDLQGITKFNFPLVASHIGEVAADVGERVVKTFPTNRTLGEYLDRHSALPGLSLAVRPGRGARLGVAFRTEPPTNRQAGG